MNSVAKVEEMAYALNRSEHCFNQSNEKYCENKLAKPRSSKFYSEIPRNQNKTVHSTHKKRVCKFSAVSPRVEIVNLSRGNKKMMGNNKYHCHNTQQFKIGIPCRLRQVVRHSAHDAWLHHAFKPCHSIVNIRCKTIVAHQKITLSTRNFAVKFRAHLLHIQRNGVFYIISLRRYARMHVHTLFLMKKTIRGFYCIFRNHRSTPRQTLWDVSVFAPRNKHNRFCQENPSHLRDFD